MVTLHVRKVHFSMKFKTTGKVKITAGGKIYLAKFVSYTNGTGTLVTLGESNLSVFTVYLLQFPAAINNCTCGQL